MQGPRLGRTLGAALIVLVALVAGGCSRLASTSASGPLLTVEMRGGECPAGTCSNSVTLERDGRVHQAAKPPNDLGLVPPATMAALDAAIRGTDFAALRRHPFTGQCPTAYDGQEVVFGFDAPGGFERIASCDVAIDFDSRLFVAVSAALAPFIAVPTH